MRVDIQSEVSGFVKLFTVCYIKKDKKTLMMERVKKTDDPHRDKWIGIGGRMKSGENPFECVVREVREESGLTLLKPKLKGLLSFSNNVESPFPGWQVFVFISTNYKGRLKRQCREGLLKWIDNKELERLNLWEGDRIFLPLLSGEKSFIARFTYHGDRLTDSQVELF